MKEGKKKENKGSREDGESTEFRCESHQTLIGACDIPALALSFPGPDSSDYLCLHIIRV